MDIPDALRATNGHSVRGSIQPCAWTNDVLSIPALPLARGMTVSYIPNNAALVEASSEAAASLTNFTGVPYEPYYKLANDLLADSVNQVPVNGPAVRSATTARHAR